MNRHYHLEGLDFEWDSNKNWSNQKKHTVSFERACEIFFDPFIQPLDDEWIDGELRDTVVGMTANWQLLYVVFVMRDEVIRLISARPVTRFERKLYENQ